MNKLKNQTQRRLALISFWCLFVTTIFAQNPIKVTGVVSSSDDGFPMIGATVMIKERPTVGTITDLDGMYVIEVKTGEHLVFSYVGASSKEVKVTKSKLDVLLSNSVTLDEVVKIGYGVAKKKEVTGASIQVKADDLDNIVSADLATSLQGIVSGVSVTSSSGDPGSVANIQIRGVTSMSGSNTPLFVVDGIPQEGNPNLSSSEIESIDILKDAASSAVYGTRGAAGVILITTKQGQAGKMKVAFDATFGLQNVAYNRLPDLLNTADQTYVEILEGRKDGKRLGDYAF